MLNPSQLSRLLIELLLLFLGILLVLLTAAGRYALPQRSPAWLGLGAFLIYWGLRAWGRKERSVRPAAAVAVRGGSLILVGATMLVAVWLPVRHATALLTVAGGILALRGLAGVLLAWRVR